VRAPPTGRSDDPRDRAALERALIRKPWRVPSVRYHPLVSRPKGAKDIVDSHALPIIRVHEASLDRAIAPDNKGRGYKQCLVLVVLKGGNIPACARHGQALLILDFDR